MILVSRRQVCLEEPVSIIRQLAAPFPNKRLEIMRYEEHAFVRIDRREAIVVADFRVRSQHLTLHLQSRERARIGVERVLGRRRNRIVDFPSQRRAARRIRG